MKWTSLHDPSLSSRAIHLPSLSAMPSFAPPGFLALLFLWNRGLLIFSFTGQKTCSGRTWECVRLPRNENVGRRRENLASSCESVPDSDEPWRHHRVGENQRCFFLSAICSSPYNLRTSLYKIARMSDSAVVDLCTAADKSFQEVIVRMSLFVVCFVCFLSR